MLCAAAWGLLIRQADREATAQLILGGECFSSPCQSAVPEAGLEAVECGAHGKSWWCRASGFCKFFPCKLHLCLGMTGKFFPPPLAGSRQAPKVSTLPCYKISASSG